MTLPAVQRSAGPALVLALLLGSTEAGAQSPTAIVIGHVQDVQGLGIPDVTVTFAATGPSLETRTDATGRFVMTALAPGTYEIRAGSPGRRSARLPSVVLTPGLRSYLPITLDVGDPVEWAEIDRTRLTPLADTSSTTLGALLLAHAPFERRQAIETVPNYLPGVARGSAFGSAAGTSTARRVDGIDVSDPLDGSVWASYIATTARQVHVRGPGTDASEGGFSNSIVDVVTEAGGTRLSGMVDALVTTDALTADTSNDAEGGSSLRAASDDAIMRSTDLSGIAGGALQRDRTRLTVAFGLSQERRDPGGPRTTLDEATPRIQSRLSFTPGSGQTLGASMLIERRSLEGVARPDVADLVDDPIADQLTGTAVGARVHYQRPLPHRLALEASYGLLTGSRRLEPAAMVPGRLDEVAGSYSGSQGLVQDSTRQRHAVNARVARDVSAAGLHLFTAGAQVEFSRIGEESEFVGNQFFIDFGGRPTLEVEWEGDRRVGRSRSESIYVDDTWTPARRLTINAGVRADFLHGSTPELGEVYSATAVQPRTSVALDLFGSGRTIVRASYGVFADPLLFTHYDRATPGASPLVTFELLANGGRREVERVVTPIYAVDDALRHPSTLETSFGLEHALTRHARVGASAVFRDVRDVVDAHFPAARWVGLSRPGLDNRPITVYRWVNRLASEGSGIIGNVDGITYLAPNGSTLGIAEASRESRVLTVHGRLDDEQQRWSVLGGVSLAAIRGTLDNAFASGLGHSSQFESASVALVNVDGRASQTPEREYTVLATTRLPWVQARVSAAYVGQDGIYYSAVRQFSSETLDFPIADAGRRVLLEPRGERALPMDHRLDLRAEYAFGLGASRRVTAYVDITNLLNRATVLRVEERYPFAAAGGVRVVGFEAPLVVHAPRQILVGGRVAF